MRKTMCSNEDSLQSINKYNKSYKKNHDPFKKLKIKEAVYNFKSSQMWKIVFQCMDKWTQQRSRYYK